MHHASVERHVFRLVLLLVAVPILGLVLLERLHEGLHVAGGGRGHGLVPEVELADERRQLRRLEGRREEAAGWQFNSIKIIWVTFEAIFWAIF